MSFKYKVLFGLAPLVFFLDQWTKQLVLAHLQIGEFRIFIPGFWDWVHVRNTGAAFGFLSEIPEWFRTPFFYGIGIIALIVLFFLFLRLDPKDRFLPFPLALIVGGVLGNSLDRIRFGNVVDFISWHIGNETLWGISLVWPSFNIADTAISTALGLLILQFVRKEFLKR